MNYVRIKNGKMVLNGREMEHYGNDPGSWYNTLGCSYPKFFKMDSLCKLAWIGAETLLSAGNAWLYEEADKTRIAVVLCTISGCLEVDKRYAESRKSVPSPSLFVYTLPNIMLGEICIRHGFQGEQLCRVGEVFDAAEMLFWVRDLLQHRNMTHCLFGIVDAVDDCNELCLFWTGRDQLSNISSEKMQAIYDLGIH